MTCLVRRCALTQMVTPTRDIWEAYHQSLKQNLPIRITAMVHHSNPISPFITALLCFKNSMKSCIVKHKHVSLLVQGKLKHAEKPNTVVLTAPFLNYSRKRGEKHGFPSNHLFWHLKVYWEVDRRTREGEFVPCYCAYS